MLHKRKTLVVALAMIGATYAASAFADDATATSSSSSDSTKASAPASNRVEVTGTYLRGIKQQGASNVTVINPDDLVKQGVVNVEQAVGAIAANTSSITSAASVGADNGGAAYADLRGLGPQYTLVLLDGRRVANQAVGGYSVDLNAIPMSAIQSISVVPGGNMIYGTDAIGGVINFITKKAYQGGEVETHILAPQHPGGLTKEASIIGGAGSLADDGYNIYGTFSASKSNEIRTDQRNFATDNLQKNGTSSFTYPFNYITNNGNGDLLNPIAPGCNPPYVVANGSGACREQTPLFYGIQPEVEQYTATLKGTKQINEDNTVSLQYMGTQTTTTTKVAPTPLITDDGIFLNPSSPYYPTAGVVADGGDPTQPVQLYGRSVEAGPRIDKIVSTTQRIMLSADGVLPGDWAYGTALAYSQNTIRHYLTGGYINGALLQDAIDNGSINPFGASPAGGWASIALDGKVEDDKYATTLADFHVNKDIYQLSAGAVQLAMGVEARHESLQSHFSELATEALSSGLENAQDTSGSRNVAAVFAQVNIPITERFNTSFSLRDDHFSDFGNTLNPEIKFDYAPIDQFKIRGTASKGFRAPSLYDIYQPNQTTYTANSYNDPQLCPGGTVAAGGNTARDCNTQFKLMQGGSTNLKPEKSNYLTFGFVVEPIKAVTATVDFWWTNIHDTIGVLSEQAIFDDPVKYANRYVRNADGSLAYVLDQYQNLGNTDIAGIDLSGTFRFPKTPIGKFSLTYNGTYLTKFDYQHEAGGQYYHGIGQFSDYNNAPIFRYKQALNLNWNQGNWSGILGSTYQTGYTDQTPDNHVPSYILWNISGTYVYQKDLTLTLGIKNLFDKVPPYSNQVYAFQQGYDPRYTDSVGRAYYLQASYKFK